MGVTERSGVTPIDGLETRPQRAKECQT
jgi:hypothetical protein